MEKRRQESWFRRQFLGLTSQENRPREGAFEAAIAAAALAIQSVEEAKPTRNGLPNTYSNGVIKQSSFMKTNGETSKKKSSEQDKKAVERVPRTGKLHLKSSLNLTKSADASKRTGW